MVIVCYHGGVKTPRDLANNPLSITSNFAKPSNISQYISVTVVCMGRQWFLDPSIYSLDDFLRMFQPHKKDWMRILFVLKNPEITNLVYNGLSSTEDSVQGFIETIQNYYKGEEDWNHLMFFSKNATVLRHLRLNAPLARHLAHYYTPALSLSPSSSKKIKIVDYFVMDTDNFSRDAMLFCEAPLILYDLNPNSLQTILQTPSLYKQTFMIVLR
uniref:Uncharacterized protein n=1 Tax=viral metagenome TaxID=1070528 RepID=A0A6C0K584_9ZZZZ